MICKHCNSQISDSCTFCPICGNKTKNAATVREKPTSAKEKTAANEIIIAFVCICVFLIVNAVMYNFNFGVFYVIKKAYTFVSEHKTTETLNSSGIDGNTAPISTKTSDSDDNKGMPKIDDRTIREIFNRYTSNTEYAVYVKNITGGYEYEYDAQRKLPPSAMTYIPICLALDNYAYSNGLNIDSDGFYFYYEPNGRERPDSEQYDGEFLTLRSYLYSVLHYGDNNCANYLVDYMGGFNYVNNCLRKLGYTDTEINRKIVMDSSKIDNTVSPNSSTAYDIGNMFKKLIFNSRVLDKNYVLNVADYADGNDKPYGVNELLGGKYTVASHCGENSVSSNEVAYITDGTTEIIVCLMSLTDDAYKSQEHVKIRRKALNDLFSYIADNQIEGQVR